MKILVMTWTMTAVTTATVVSLPAVAQTDIEGAACFWGDAQAIIEVAAEVCPHLGVTQLASDAIAAMQPVETFEPCYRKGAVNIARKRPTTDEEKSLFCVQAANAPGFNSTAPFMQRK